MGVVVAMAAVAGGGWAGDLSFSDPARTVAAPGWAVGQVSRAPDFDVLPGFRQPPPGFGIVPFHWWLGDPLTGERLGWQLEQMAGMGVAGYQINYAHSDRGGRSYGLTYPSEPPLFSEAWWQLVGWFMGEAGKQGAAVSLSDYTLGFGQGWCVDELLREHPEVAGMELRLGGDGTVVAERVPWSLNPLHPMAGKWYAEKFFGRFEQRFPGEGGRGLNFFFSDELQFGVGGRLWSEQFAAEFRRRKGYDITPELPALFKDTGPRTPKVRLDYSDVMVALAEEGYFKPVFDWHQQRGMTMGCDHGGRGRDVAEFGDYFRTQRWMQGPGADQPQLGKDLVKAKVAASIAHLYQRPRVWLEGFYGSGWGTTPAALVDATLANYVMGFNMLGLHGMYYSTHGGWWEWAPPDNTFRMPYWRHLRGFMDCLQRLSFLLSQGHHRCDVAIVYPVAPVEAGMDGQLAVETAFNAAQELYGRGVDLDFIDFESLARAEVADRELRVSGERYRVLVLPAMKAARHSTLEKARQFHRAGGSVVALGALPEASDRAGRDDPEVAAIVGELFPGGPARGLTALPGDRDYEGPGLVQHRRIGGRDVYAVYGAPAGAECRFRAVGAVELWDPWTGAVHPLPVLAQDAAGTRLRLPLSETEIQLVVFGAGEPDRTTAAPVPAPEVVELGGDWEFELAPVLDNRFGDFHWPPTPGLVGAEVRRLWYCEGARGDGPWRRVTCSFGPQFMKSLAPPPAADTTPCEFSWRWGIEGDPGHQGYHGLKAEVHDELLAIGRPRHQADHAPSVFSYDAGEGDTYFTTAVVAPRAMTGHFRTGPVKPAEVRVNGEPVAGTSVRLHAGANPLVLRYPNARPGRTWFVVAGTPGAAAAGAAGDVFSPAACWIWHPGGAAAGTRWFRKGFELDAVPTQARLRITCDNGYAVSINGTAVGAGQRWETVQEYEVAKALRRGRNELLVRADNAGDSAGLIAELVAGPRRIATDGSWRASEDEAGPAVAAQQLALFADSLWFQHPQGPPRLDPPGAAHPPAFRQSPLATSWWNDPDVLPFDVRADDPAPAGWYRFDAPPGLRALTVSARGKVQAQAGEEVLDPAGADGGAVTFALPHPAAGPVTVRLRIAQERGCYGGAAIPEPIRLDCGPGRLAAGDWSRLEGLECYSGGAWYRRTVDLTPARARGRVVLDLGAVAASAEVRVNGRPAGVRVAPPWRVDLTGLVQPGANRLEVMVCNTLANHYLTIPTRYRGDPVSGLLGPVRLEFAAPPGL